MNAKTGPNTEVIFLDREGERDTLLAALPPVATAPQLLVVRGPTGVGKSSLTDWVTATISPSISTITVDPHIRGSDRDPHRAYEGYYLQLCVAEVSEILSEAHSTIEPFPFFVQSRGWKNLKGFDMRGTVRDAASVPKLVGRAFDATERMTAKGAFAPEALLKSDDAIAVEICAEYFRYVTSELEFVLVLREAQHCDTTSLRHLLRCLSDEGVYYPLLEYTTSERKFQKRHQVQIDQIASPKIWDIDVLPWPYVTELLEQYGQHDQEVVGEFRARWDGNLRSVEELQFRVTIGSGNITTGLNQPLPHDAIDAIRQRMSELPRASRLALSILREHNEPISHEAFEVIWQSVDPALGLPLRISDVLDMLRDSYLSVTSAQIGLNNDDVASAISSITDAVLYTTGARRLLLRHYQDAAGNSQQASAGRAVALRHATRFAVLLQDPVALETTLNDLTLEIESKGDATIYVDQVVACLTDTDDLGKGERQALAAWAARIAYSSSNFGLAVKAIEIAGLTGPKWQSVLAHSLIEEVREPEAQEIATEIRAKLAFRDADLMSDLILGNLDLVKGNLDTCIQRLTRVVSDAKDRGSVLLGHAYRLLESAVPTDDAIDYCRLSAEFYDSAGLHRSAGQSRITVTRHLARLGRTDEALQQLDIASKQLVDVASSRQFFLNNRAAVEMLSPHPDFDAAASDLRSALLLSKDRFSDLTILQNLAISIWQGRSASDAIGTVEQAMRAMRDVDSTTCLMADTVGFTAYAVFKADGRQDDAKRVVDFIVDTVGINIDDSPYWAWRFGRSAKHPETYAANIMDKPYHPNFLSQWQLDWEVLRVLFE